MLRKLPHQALSIKQIKGQDRTSTLVRTKARPGINALDIENLLALAEVRYNRIELHAGVLQAFGCCAAAEIEPVVRGVDQL
jgi:hypothetical protein